MLVLIYLFRAFLWAKKVLLKKFIYYKLMKEKAIFCTEELTHGSM